MNTYKRHRFPPEIISYAVWVYYRFNMSHRDVKDLLAERGIIVSLVGPRPPLPQEVAEYSAYEKKRLAIKSGITCTWQVSSRSDIPFREQVRLDIEYINRRCLRMDLLLLLKTIPAVLFERGAY